MPPKDYYTTLGLNKNATADQIKKACRGGHTTWCPICRVRSFIYDNNR